MKTILITGATRGLGLAIAQALARDADLRLVLGVRDVAAGQRLAQALGPRARAVALDMGSAAAIRAFAATWQGPLHGLVNNAGVQVHGPMQVSPDGVELTLAVNHLGPLRLTLALLPALAGGVVLGIGSGTHNPQDRVARLFGFRGGSFTSLPALAAGQTVARHPRPATLERYATSKLLAMASSVELARRHPETRFLVLDPGLMPGTGLVRSAPWPVRAAWTSVLRWAVPILPGASTPDRSAAAAQAMLLGDDPSGAILDPQRRPAPVWARVTDPGFGAMVLDQSLAFLADPAGPGG